MHGDLYIKSPKIAAIKQLRSRRDGMSLKEAKDLVEQYIYQGHNWDSVVDAIIADLPPLPPKSDLATAARAFLNVATFPAWAGDDCRLCAYDLNYGHAPDCEYFKAEAALRAALEGE